MTTEEFSNEFDTLVSSYRRFKNFDSKEILDSLEFDEYEKSVFLTKAQEELITSYYSGRNTNLYSFENTEEIRRYLSSLIKTAYLSAEPNVQDETLLYSETPVFTLPEDVWFITYEAAKLVDSEDDCLDKKVIEVTPVTQDYLHRIKRNPFRGPSKRRALRLDRGNNEVEILSKYSINKYIIRYITKPSPIILTNLSGISIDGESNKQTCLLNDSLHRPILELAVKLALQSKGINLEKENK